MNISIHICRFSKTCRMYGAPNRVNIRVGHHFFDFALNRDSRFVEPTRWVNYRRLEAE